MRYKRGFRRKRGLSTIVTTLILIMLTIVLVSIIWTVVNNIVTGSLDKAESCFGVFDKVTLNNKYTCYNSSSGEFLFSVNIKDINIDGVLFSISSKNGTSKSYTLTNEDQNIVGLGPYPSGLGTVKLPEKDAGKTYVSIDFSEKPNSIEIAPIVNRQQCEVSDSSYEIGAC